MLSSLDSAFSSEEILISELVFSSVMSCFWLSSVVVEEAEDTLEEETAELVEDG